MGGNINIGEYNRLQKEYISLYYRLKAIQKKLKEMDVATSHYHGHGGNYTESRIKSPLDFKIREDGIVKVLNRSNKAK